MMDLFKERIAAVITAVFILIVAFFIWAFFAFS